MYNEEAKRMMKKYVVAGGKSFYSLKAVKSHLRERKEKQDSDQEGKEEVIEEKVGEGGRQGENYKNLKIKVV